jgi:hypothetical protein
LASVSRELVEKFSKRKIAIEKMAREESIKLNAKVAAFMDRTGMDFDHAREQVKAELGSQTRESKSSAKLTPEEHIAH